MIKHLLDIYLQRDKIADINIYTFNSVWTKEKTAETPQIFSCFVKHNPLYVKPVVADWTSR